MRYIFPLLFALSVTACATGGTPESDLFIACKSLSTAEQNLRPYKPKMTAGQVEAVQTALRTATPICAARVIDITDARTAIAAVNAELGRMLAVQSEVSR